MPDEVREPKEKEESPPPQPDQEQQRREEEEVRLAKVCGYDWGGD